MQLRLITLISFSFLFYSCSQFQTGRSYLSEMEHDDSRFFHPENDFPVVVGDNGDFGLNDGERMKRTPASVHDIAERRHQRVLRRELDELESSQTSEGLALYKKYKSRLATTSDRIYFLNLPEEERRDYLISRGLITTSKASRSFASLDDAYGVRTQGLSMGMTKDQVVGNWGRPSRIEIAGNPTFENERWLYQLDGASKYIYFESGQVEGWE